MKSWQDMIAFCSTMLDSSIRNETMLSMGKLRTTSEIDLMLPPPSSTACHTQRVTVQLEVVNLPLVKEHAAPQTLSS